MKKLLFLLLAFPSLIVSAEEAQKSIQPFLVVSSEKDPSIPTDSAVFAFTVIHPDWAETGNAPVIHASCNGRYFQATPDQQKQFTTYVAAGTYHFQFYIYPGPHTGNYFEIYSDSVTIAPGFRTKVELRFQEAYMEIMVDKPVVYLYPKEETVFSATVVPNGTLTFTYPEIGTGWKGTAFPDGNIAMNNRNYPYLFWEANCLLIAAAADPNKGFVVEKNRAVAFLEEKLAEMGLNQREQTDFITYWGPKMAAYDRCFVHFLFNASCDAAASLTLTPQPDMIFRVYMVWSPLHPNEQPQPDPQYIPSVDRSGFTVIEWGGSQLTSNQLHIQTAQR